MEKEFKKRAEKVYQEITEVLRKHNVRMDWDEGEGILICDKHSNDTIPITSGLGHFDDWE